MSTFTISTQSNSENINITVPLNVSYVVDEKYTVDNITNTVYPNIAIVHQYVYSVVSKIDRLLKNRDDAPTYVDWNWNNWYSAGSLVYTYDTTTSYYKFYKALKMTNPLIPLTNTTFWNTYTSGIWALEETYAKGTVVYMEENGVYSFYESFIDVPDHIEITNSDYWKELTLNTWSYDTKYNIGSKVYDGNIIYTCIKTVLPVTRITDTEYWTPYFDYYALIKLSDVSVEFKDSLELFQSHIIELKEKFEIDTTNMLDEEISTLYDEMYNLNITIQSDWVNVQELYENINYTISSTYGLIWKNMYDANIYIKELNLYNVDPIKTLESIKYLPSFQTLLTGESNNAIVVYVNNLYNQQDPAQKNGGYFIYDLNKSRFIKALVGQHDHKNLDILDEISQSFDELSETDTTSNKVLTIVKEAASEGSQYSWDFHIQWKDIDVIPDKPLDGNEYVLITDTDGNLTWTDKISSAIAFIKKDYIVPTQSTNIEFDVVLSYDNEGIMTDTFILFKNSLYINDFTYEYDINSNVLTIALANGETFDADDMLTLLVIRNTSAEMLRKLSDDYLSKKEAIDILSNGTISLRDYVKREELFKYSLRNHIHTRYASKDHSHWGVYADYYHNHDGLYMTRDEVNNILGNILSINPDLIDIISSIASDLSTLEGSFVTQAIYSSFVSTVNERLDDLEEINQNELYMDPNTGQVSTVEVNDQGITFTPVNIESYQIQTKYKISDDPGETTVYTLEEYLDNILGLISTEELRIKKIYQQLMVSDKVMKSHTLLSNSSEDLTLTNFKITSVRLDITVPFDENISVYLDEVLFIDSDEIIEDVIGVTTYETDININTDKTISFDLGISNTGDAILTITGYTI